MDAHMKTIALACKDGAETNSMTFPQIVGTLKDAGFESYAIDFRRETATYYRPDGDSVEFATGGIDTPVSAEFHKDSLIDAIREAQTLVEGYTYKGFCAKAKASGCAGYLVSLLGRRVMYYGRTADVHIEHFPSAEA